MLSTALSIHPLSITFVVDTAITLLIIVGYGHNDLTHRARD